MFSLRTLLHKRPAGAVRPPSDAEELQSAGALVNSMLEESLTQLEQESKSSSHDCIRWELGACWVQQLQTQAVAEKEAAEGKAKEGANGPSAGSEKTLKASLVPDLNRKQDNISKDEGENIAHCPSLLCFPISSVCHFSFDFSLLNMSKLYCVHS